MQLHNNLKQKRKAFTDNIYKKKNIGEGENVPSKIKF